MKAIRVENADASNCPVVVQVLQKTLAGRPDTIVREHFLADPASMTPADLEIGPGRYLIVKVVE